MKIWNATKNRMIAQQAKCAGTSVTRMLGLLGRSTLPEGQALIINPCKAVHTWFMRFSIDCLFVDQHGEIVHLMEELQPWRYTPFIKRAAYVIELPAHTIRNTQTEIGDRLEITS
ncbi:DUF192 domain-containing protein [Brevibacillus borstelensis]|uniref:DUF192 domain-containing protein n=1 Tax=Brevibacillus borstelensis TaxID=45462 RepID=UPI0004698753|nr:DUF192 domain-containing protein [Brevibacillus borstelensis]MCC0565831.1 DUF192 domain-containing protein [Brevibacillus borstelensis]NOU54131.1 DUF192 domain-containing protein [Brevibacillus borstelensis]